MMIIVIVIVIVIVVAVMLPMLAAPLRLLLNVIFPVLVHWGSFIDRHWLIDDRHTDVVDYSFAPLNGLVRCRSWVTTGYTVAGDSPGSGADGGRYRPTVASADLVAEQPACDSAYNSAAVSRSCRLDGNLLIPALLTRPFYGPVFRGACHHR